MKKSPLRNIILLWAAWSVTILAYQALVSARFEPARPDYALEWTPRETLKHSQDDKPYLVNPFMNAQVSWDSEFYLSIATVGYRDPAVRSIPMPDGSELNLSHAFMPFYPMAIRLLAWPLKYLGMEAIPAATLVGVVISLLGTLGGMLALFDLARDDLGPEAGFRAAFYLIVFPAGFFLAQVYTEGLFVGLAFGSLALVRRKRYLWAALLACLATWTRAVGAALLIPLIIPWIRDGDWMDLDLEWEQLYTQGLPWRGIGKALLHLAPLFAFVVWKFSYLGAAFDLVEANFFGRGFLSMGSTFSNWSQALSSLWGEQPQTAAYYVVEFLAIALGFTASGWMLQRDRGLGLFSLAVVFLSLTSGPAQGMHRYVMGAPAVFLALGAWGKSPAFDRAWTLVSILLMGLLAALFTFDYWTG